MKHIICDIPVTKECALAIAKCYVNACQIALDDSIKENAYEWTIRRNQKDLVSARELVKQIESEES